MLKKLGFYKHSQKKKRYMSSTQKDILSGLAGGAAGTIATFPLDTLTTRAQARHGKKVPKLWYKKILNLYKGIPYKLMKTVPGTAVTLATYGFTKRHLDKQFTSKK